MAHPSLKCKNLLFVRLIFQQPNYECPFRFSKESRKKPAFLPTKKREKLCVVHVEWYSKEERTPIWEKLGNMTNSVYIEVAKKKAKSFGRAQTSTLKDFQFTKIGYFSKN